MKATTSMWFMFAAFLRFLPEFVNDERAAGSKHIVIGTIKEYCQLTNDKINIDRLLLWSDLVTKDFYMKNNMQIPQCINDYASPLVPIINQTNMTLHQMYTEYIQIKKSYHSLERRFDDHKLESSNNHCMSNSMSQLSLNSTEIDASKKRKSNAGSSISNSPAANDSLLVNTTAVNNFATSNDIATSTPTKITPITSSCSNISINSISMKTTNDIDYESNTVLFRQASSGYVISDVKACSLPLRTVITGLFANNANNLQYSFVYGLDRRVVHPVKVVMEYILKDFIKPTDIDLMTSDAWKLGILSPEYHVIAASRDLRINEICLEISTRIHGTNKKKKPVVDNTKINSIFNHLKKVNASNSIDNDINSNNNNTKKKKQNTLRNNSANKKIKNTNTISNNNKTSSSSSSSSSSNNNNNKKNTSNNLSSFFTTATTTNNNNNSRTNSNNSSSSNNK